MDLTDEETEFTREMHTCEISQKDLMSCTTRELRIRCANDERIIKHAYQVMKKLEKENAELKAKIDYYKEKELQRLEERDVNEEFE